MGLGPSLSIRQSQQLVLTPQLAQAIKLLKQVTDKFPGFEPAERNLKKLGA